MLPGKSILLILFITGFHRMCVAQNITIIESESYNSGHVMDTVWRHVAIGMGMNATIVDQSTLYDTTFFATTDALIVSSGVITLTNSQINTISAFMKSGKSLYLQGEYDCFIYNTNSTFENLVNDNGGSLTLNGTTNGDLNPMIVLGSLATTPNIVTPLSYFWYGCRATTCSYVEPFLQYGAEYFGFIFCPPNSNFGKVVYTSDQDWARTQTSNPLIENILTLLTSGTYQCSGSNFFGVYLPNDTTLCPGSSIVLNAGNSSSAILWSTGATDSSIIVNDTGIYWVTVTSGTCIASDTIVLTDTLCSPSISFNTSDTDICQKFCINFFDLSQNNPTSWQWTFEGGSPPSSTDQNPGNICYNQPGTYNVTLVTTTSGGNDTLTLNDYITVYPTPAFPAITQTGYVLTSSVATSYQWQLNSMDIPGATDQSYTVMQTGLYTVIVFDGNGCKNSASLYVQIVGVNEVSDEISVDVFPNPNNGTFVLELSDPLLSDAAAIGIENSLGQVIYSSEEKLSSGKLNRQIELTNATKGIYFLDLKTSGHFVRKKILISN